MIVLLALLFVILLTLAIATSVGMKSPNYVQGFESGYKASYQAGFDESNLAKPIREQAN